jgi:hypothetical protein
MGQAHVTEPEMTLLADLYPQGQILCFEANKLVGLMLSRILPYQKYAQGHTLAFLEDISHFEDDAQNGDCVYGLDIVVHPDYKAFRLGFRLSSLLIDQIETDNFKSFIGVSRVASFAEYANQYTLEEYVTKVLNRQIKDKALSFHMIACGGLSIIKCIYDFDPKDTASMGCGVLVAFCRVRYDASRPSFKPKQNNLQENW